MNKIRISPVSVLVGAFFMMFCSGLSNFSFTFFVLPVTGFLNCSTAAFALFVSIITACTAVFSPFVSKVNARFGVRRPAAIAAAAGLCGYLLLASLQNIWQVYLSALIIGLAIPFISIPTVLVINSWFKENVSVVTGIAMSGSGFAGIFASLLIPSVIERLGWRPAYLCCGLIWLTASLLALVLGCRTPSDGSVRNAVNSGANTSAIKSEGNGQGGKPVQTVQAAEAVYDPSVTHSIFFWLLIFTSVTAAGASTISSHLAVLLHTKGMNAAVISFLTSSMSLALCIFKIVEGFLYGTIRNRRSFICIIFLCGAGCYLLLNTSSIPLLTLAVVFFGIASASVTALYPLILNSLYGRATASAVWGLFYSMFSIGMAVYSPVYGYIYDHTGSYTIGLLFSAACFIFSAFYIPWMFRSGKK